MFLPVISPHDPNIALEVCDMTGAYITMEAGRSWRMFNLQGRISAFAFDPANPKVIYAGNSALWRSDDIGKTWRMIFPRPSPKTVHLMRDDHAEGPLISDDPAYSPGRARWIAVDPADSKRIYALFAGRAAAWLAFLKDRGASWTRLREFPGERFHALYFDAGLRAVSDRPYLSCAAIDGINCLDRPAAPYNRRAVGVECFTRPPRPASTSARTAERPGARRRTFCPRPPDSFPSPVRRSALKPPTSASRT